MNKECEIKVSKAQARIDNLLKLATEKKASDLHLKAGVFPVIRRQSKLRPLGKDLKPISASELKEISEYLLPEHQKIYFLKHKNIDIAYTLKEVGRFRLNLSIQRGTIRIVVRIIPFKIPHLNQLNLPSVIENISAYQRGLILISGATGSGKSTTGAAMINQINHTSSRHIITIEDPIEFLIKDRKSIITQKEIGLDSLDFPSSLRSSLRQDPDVIFIGELRDKETIETALVAAETGHLVIATIHAQDSIECVNRVVSVFEFQQQLQARIQLAHSLKSIISLRLTRSIDKKQFLPATEILINNSRIRELILDSNRTGEINDAIEESKASWGMQTFDQCLMDLVSSGKISYREALKHTTLPEDFTVRFHGISQLGKNELGTVTAVRTRLEKDWEELEDIEIETFLHETSKKK